ncbi:MAG TPA: L,D-transpeptidase [Hyphomicrobiales bacterium]|nr:L,D-transpeptidase [Hyphomicrobiales bacterium]
MEIRLGKFRCKGRAGWKAALAGFGALLALSAVHGPAQAAQDGRVSIFGGWGNRQVAIGGERHGAQMAARDTGARRSQGADPAFARRTVKVRTPHAPGTIIIDTNRRYLYLVKGDGTAVRYGVGVGRPGFEWAGTHTVTRKAEWPDWRPPEEMRARQPYLPEMMPGGPRNPLGARALYLGSTLYRIHGTNEATTIGQAVSSGCIRMLNEDVIDLYQQVDIGTKVVVF